jgi:hypothetical protein
VGGALSALRSLVEHPANNPTAAAVGIGIVVVALLLAAASLLAWGMPRRGSAETDPFAGRARRTGTSARISRIGRLVASILTLAAVAVAYAVTSQSSACGTSCHAMVPDTDTWRLSSHAAVPCVRCHEGLPILSAPTAVASRTRSLIAELSEQGTGGESSIPASRCLSCHGSIADRVVVAENGVAMSHRQVIASGASCDDCHGAQGHEPPGRVPPMSACLRCHDGTRASAACAACHRRSTGRLLVPTDSRFGKVELAETPTCGGCHSEATCDACHGLRMPHPADYKDPQRHARPAAFGRKVKLCYRCHTFADCNECHLSFNAHVQDWQKRHGEYPRDTEWCGGCHRTAYMCGLCHNY